MMKRYDVRKKMRLEGCDYSSDGYYFVTIGTNDRNHFFGEIANDNMMLNQCGMIANDAWLELPNHHANILLDEYIVMPNHIHGIIIMKCPVGFGPARTAINRSKSNLSVIIGSYKSTVTKQINRIGDVGFKWQRSFYDERIRTNNSFKKIQRYINTNPYNWGADENNINKSAK